MIAIDTEETVKFIGSTGIDTSSNAEGAITIAVDSTVVRTSDIGKVTNAMLEGNIANAKLLNSTVTIGSTVVALGTTTANLAGLNSVTATNFIGNATTVTNGVYTNSIGAVTDIMLAGSIANNKLTNSSITVNGTSISLGSSATITAAAGTLTGNTLASGVTASSLTSVGTLTNLSVTNTITGSVSGNAGTVTDGVYTTGTYDNPSWITSLAYSKLTGTPTIPSLTGYATETFVTTRGYLTSVGTISYNDLTDKPNLASTYTFNVAADDSTLRTIGTEETVKFVGAGGITTASDAEGAITITQGSTDQIIKVAGSFASDQPFKSEVISNLTDGVTINTWMGLPAFATTKSWKFDYNGNLTFPDTTVQTTAWTGTTDRLSVTGSTVVLAKDQYDTSRLTFTGGATIETAGYLSGVGGLGIVDSSVQQSVVVKSDRAQITVGFPDQGTGIDSYNEWQFLKDGSISLPSSGIIKNRSGAGKWTFGTDGALTIPGDIKSNGNINIDINLSDSTLRRWHFGEDGELTVPGPIIGLGNSKLDFTTFGANTAYLTTTDNDFTALTMGTEVAELYANNYVQIRTNTAGVSKNWTFNTDGSTTLPGTVDITYTPDTAVGAAITATGKDTQGGTGYFDFLKATNTTSGATNPNKSFRLDSVGSLHIINSAYTATLLALTDAGALDVKSSISVNGKQAVNGPAFRAYVDSGQTISTDSQQKVTFGTETFDTNGNFSSSRFTPTIEGYYQLNATVRLSGNSGTGECMIILYKNGSEYARGTNESGTEQGQNFWSMQVSDIAYANGSSDYFEIYIQQGSANNRTTTAGSTISYFSGSMIRGA
jgi:hypothetical protein